MPKEVNAAQQKEKEQEEKVTRVKEIISERTENSNTYLLSDGSKQLAIYPENIRYKAGEELVDYNAELTDISGKDKKILEKEALKDVTEYANVNESGDSKQFFPKIISKENGVVMTKNNYVVEMAPVISKNDEYSLAVRDTNANYTNSEKYIEYKYESLNNGVKESIILNSESEEYEFSYEINTDNVVLNQRKNDRGIQVLDKNSKEIVANISAPNIIDGTGNVDYENVKYVLIHKENKTILKVVVKKEYFEKENIKYPITIDPTMLWMGDYLTAVGVWSASFMANTTMTNSQLTVSNYLMNSYPYNSINRVYIDTGKLLTTEAFVGGGNSISDKCIESAYLSIYEYNKPAYYPTGTVQVKKAIGEWDASNSAPIDAEGKFMSRSKIKYYQYENKQWPDQVTRYSDNPYVTTHNITYDNAGNPLNYYNDMIFTWERGQDLKSISDKNGELLNFKYIDNDFRTYKETKDYISTYELDESKIIRETLQYKNSDRCYDIWYFYDAIGEVAGYQFSYWVNNNEVQEVVYYEKDKLGNVIGLMNESGVEFATYSYDSWGAINSTSCEEGYETAYKLNNFTYRGYYRDSETGFYYLNNRYYDPEIKQFINADNPKVVNQFVGNRVMDNMYIYCDGNPVDRVDPSGEWYYTLEEYNIVESYKRITAEKDAKNLFFSIVLACNSSYMKSEYSHNCKVYDQKYKYNSYIWGQNNAPFTNMTYGGNKISNVGCEIMAVYNAIISCGYDLYFPDLVLQFSMNGMKLLGGMWGSNIYELDDVLYAYGVRYEKYYLEKSFLEEINRSDRFILSVMNNNSIFNGKHTFYCYNNYNYFLDDNGNPTENNIIMYNYNCWEDNYTKENVNNVLTENSFLVGYLIEPFYIE